MAKQASTAHQNSQLDPISAPQTTEEYIESGWTHYSNKEYYRAEADLQKALETNPDNPDILYALGMAQQASGRSTEAIQTFERVIQILGSTPPADAARTNMVRKLARGHINYIRTGDWNLSEAK